MCAPKWKRWLFLFEWSDGGRGRNTSWKDPMWQGCAFILEYIHREYKQNHPCGKERVSLLEISLGIHNDQ